MVKAITIAKLHGKKIILDPAGVLGPSSPGVETSLPAEYFSVDVMIPNLYEASLAVGDDLRKAVRFAAAAGALACTKFGSVDAMPVKSEIIELMQKQEPE